MTHHGFTVRIAGACLTWSLSCARRDRCHQWCSSVPQASGIRPDRHQRPAEARQREIGACAASSCERPFGASMGRASPTGAPTSHNWCCGCAPGAIPAPGPKAISPTRAVPAVPSHKAIATPPPRLGPLLAEHCAQRKATPASRVARGIVKIEACEWPLAAGWDRERARVKRPPRGLRGGAGANQSETFRDEQR